MARLCIIRNIDSAHGKNIHGHTFRLEFNFIGEVVNNMVDNIDFHEISPKIDKVVDNLNHTYIDDVIKVRATVENIAVYLLKELKNIESLYSVVVYEGQEKYVEILKSEVKENL